MMFSIETGGYRARQEGKTMAAAVAAAFKRRAPKNPGALTRARALDRPWEYISTAAMLERAGYAVKASGSNNG